MTDDFRLSVTHEPVPRMDFGQQYKASAYQVMHGTGTVPLEVAMQVEAVNVKTWINQVGRCFELASLSYDRETQMMTATFRTGNGLALIAEVQP